MRSMQQNDRVSLQRLAHAHLQVDGQEGEDRLHLGGRQPQAAHLVLKQVQVDGDVLAVGVGLALPPAQDLLCLVALVVDLTLDHLLQHILCRR